MIVFIYILLAAILILPSIIYIIWLKGSKKVGRPLPLTFPNSVSLLLIVYNEELHVKEKIQSLYRQCVEARLEKFEILVVSDGSTDGSNSIITELTDGQTIKHLFVPDRKGKSNAINEGMKQLIYPLVLLTDARQKIQPMALKNLIPHFKDPTVGAVSGCLVNGNKESRIRKTINSFKYRESKIGGTLGVYGPFYLMRKSCFSRIPENIILDDLFISLQIVSKNKRILLEPLSIVKDVSFKKLYCRERISRITTGLFQILRQHFGLIRKLTTKDKFMLFMHKYYRFLLLPGLILLTILSAFNPELFIFHILFNGAMIILGAVLKVLSPMIRILFYSIKNLIEHKPIKSVLWDKVSL